MEKNKKRFFVAAFIPVIILVGVLLYISPFSTDTGSGTTAQQGWNNKHDGAAGGGHGRGVMSPNGGSDVTHQGSRVMAYASPLEGSGKDNGTMSRRGQGRRSSSSHGDNDVTAQRGRGRGNGSSHQNSGSTVPQYGNQEFSSQQRGHGRGAGNQSALQNHPAPYSNNGRYATETSGKLKGRDFASFGTMTSLSGTLVRIGDEWGLKTGDTVYEIHMGPAEYRASWGVVLKEGAPANVTGFTYGTNISVATMETGGSSIVLKDETGRPAWAGSRFSQGGRTGNLTGR